MLVIYLDSIDDSRLDAYRNLKQTNSTRWSNTFIAEGPKVVERLLASDLKAESILIRAGRFATLNPELIGNVETFVLPDDLAPQLVGYNFHAGVLACGVRPENPSQNEFANNDQNSLLVACIRVTDPDNLGTIIRTARAFGASGILTTSDGCAPYSRRVLRVSMGNAFYLPIFESKSIADDLRVLQENHGYKLIATALSEAAIPLREMTPPPRSILMLGNEADGLEPELIELADQVVTIPMQAGTDSLNIGIAAGIFLHHFSEA